MPSLKLSNPFRRGVERPSLKERAAALRATAGKVLRPPVAMPEVESPAPPDLPAPSVSFAAVPLDGLFALADLYWNAARHFHVAAFWPKLQAGEEQPGSNIAIHEGDRLSGLFAAVVAEMARREPRDDTEADQRREWQVRRALDCGDGQGALSILMDGPALGRSAAAEA